MTKYVIIYTTVESIDKARKIAAECVTRKLIACANILPAVESIYWWEGETESSAEIPMFLKTIEANAEMVIDLVKTMHDYKCPCIVALPIVAGTKDFLKWISSSVEHS